jgi:hypothetical protein
MKAGHNLLGTTDSNFINHIDNSKLHNMCYLDTYLAMHSDVTYLSIYLYIYTYTYITHVYAVEILYKRKQGEMQVKRNGRKDRQSHVDKTEFSYPSAAVFFFGAAFHCCTSHPLMR